MSSTNGGNLLELVELFSCYGSVIKLHLNAIKEKQSTKNVVSLPLNRSQTDHNKALSISIKRVILKEMHESEIFSILVDKTTDVSH